MHLAKVVGNVWGARQAESLQGHRLLLVRPLRVSGARGTATPGAPEAGLEPAPGTLLVVVDALGAGPGEIVLVAHGSRSRDLTIGAAVATKEIVVAIVDRADVGGAGAEP